MLLFTGTAIRRSGGLTKHYETFSSFWVNMMGRFEHSFTITVEVVPPRGSDAGSLVNQLKQLTQLPVDRFSVASNPVAKPRMSTIPLCQILVEETGIPAVPHVTTRDHNRLSLQGDLWAVRALDLPSVFVTTGDFVALKDRGMTSTVRDLDVFDLISMAREAGLEVGTAFDPFSGGRSLDDEVRRLEKKVEAGAGYAITQPVYAEEDAQSVASALTDTAIPVIMGVLPLRTIRHGEFLRDKVHGIAVPGEVISRMENAEDPLTEGNRQAREMIILARELFAGVCIMPPFDHYEVLSEILG